MAGESSKETSEDQVESIIDELISEIFSESGISAESTMRGMATTAALIETALGPRRKPSKSSMLERLLVAQAFAGELADALAPALAEQLAPRLMKALEELMSEAAAKKSSAVRAGGPAKKPEGK